MAEHLAAFAFGTAIRVLDMSKEAQQCEMEVARVAVRMQNVLGTLDHAGGHFTEQAGLEANLLELKGVLENVKVLVGRCGPPKIPKRIKDAVLRQRNPNRQALIDAEKKLEVITQVRKAAAEMQARPLYSSVYTWIAKMKSSQCRWSMACFVGRS